jgi:hypothetical protein
MQYIPQATYYLDSKDECIYIGPIGYAGDTWISRNGITEQVSISRVKAHRVNTRGVRIIATLTDTECTDACWCASGHVCHCSCNGKNHGIGHAPTE